MIRKCIIGILLLAALWLSVEWVASYIWPKEWSSERRWDRASDFSNPNPGYRITAGIITQSGSMGMLDSRPRRFSAVCLLKRLEDPATMQSIPFKRPWSRSILSMTYSEFSFITSPQNNSDFRLHFRCLETPAWLPVLLFSTYPIFSFVHGPLLRFRRLRRGLCVKCKYDLEGNTSGTCPECGTATNRE